MASFPGREEQIPLHSQNGRADVLLPEGKKNNV